MICVANAVAGNVSVPAFNTEIDFDSGFPPGFQVLSHLPKHAAMFWPKQRRVLGW